MTKFLQEGDSMQERWFRMKLTPRQAEGKTKESRPHDSGKPWSSLT